MQLDHLIAVLIVFLKWHIGVKGEFLPFILGNWIM